MRIEAARIRDRLREYYDGDGQGTDFASKVERGIVEVAPGLTAPGADLATANPAEKANLLSASISIAMICLSTIALFASIIEPLVNRRKFDYLEIVFSALAVVGRHALLGAPLVALLLKRTLLRGETPVFVMEMPLYKRPSIKAVARRSLEAGWMFLRRAGTVILASMIVVWALLYFPTTGPNGENYPERYAELEDDEDSADKLNELNRY